jgi:hypothetical protein
MATVVVAFMLAVLTAAVIGRVVCMGVRGMPGLRAPLRIMPLVAGV